MTTKDKKIYTDDFKEGVVKNALEHPDEPNTSIAKIKLICLLRESELFFLWESKEDIKVIHKIKV